MAHLVITCVMALFARYRVKYLSIAWIMGIFAGLVACVIPFSELIESTRPAVLHPGTLLGLMGWVFLQSIYPLQITMPGYLQWGRMWFYALPIGIVTLAYGVVTLLGITSPNYYTYEEVLGAFWTIDVMLRILMLGVAIYYIINIFRLPKIMLRFPDVPRYLKGYATMVGLSSCLYFWLIISFSVTKFEVWLVVLTLANLYMCFRTLESLALEMPQPIIKEVDEAPDVDEIDKIDREDFNEANRQRFERVEFWMQHNRKAWTEPTFGRDNLCDETGINRHLILQALRSQGYNNVHEYINAYRVDELKRMIARGLVRSPKDAVDAGFGTVKTARTAFERTEGLSLDDFLARHIN